MQTLTIDFGHAYQAQPSNPVRTQTPVFTITFLHNGVIRVASRKDPTITASFVHQSGENWRTLLRTPDPEITKQMRKAAIEARERWIKFFMGTLKRRRFAGIRSDAKVTIEVEDEGWEQGGDNAGN